MSFDCRSHQGRDAQCMHTKHKKAHRLPKSAAYRQTVSKAVAKDSGDARGCERAMVGEGLKGCIKRSGRSLISVACPPHLTLPSKIGKALLV